ncbi:uncharacterized protein LOC129264739 [Lytechinus pictus]|uniref:uncharacterized protein LOC129264739 n=1 Tax=Lytechinus pictus TaxID=7653 RepID=UPI0030B9E0C7
MGIMETLKDITKTTEWDNEVSESNYVSIPTTTNASDHHPLVVDVVSLTLAKRKTLSPSFMDRLVAFLAIPYNMLSQGSGYSTYRNASKPAVVARSWKMEGDSSGWMFSRTVSKGKGHSLDELWSYTLVQSSTEDTNKSLIHHLACTMLSDKNASHSEKPASRLSALKQYFELKHLKVGPLCHCSLKHLTSHTLQSKACINGTSNKYSLKESLPDSVMPIYNALDSLSKSDSQVMEKLSLSWPNDTNRPRTSSLGVWQDNSSSDDAGFYSERQYRSRRQRAKKTMSADVTAGGEGRKRNSLEKKTRSLDRTTNEKELGDIEDSGVADNMVEYQTLADQGAEVVLEESIKAARINVNGSEDDQMQQTGGWSFHCLEKDVVILKKPKNGKYYSYLGKGVIKASPAAVFKAIRNPRTRFTYDTMLKKMDIVKTFSDDLCVYHMVHEVPQILKKESRDFCVLQVCKTVGERYIVACQSIDCRDCPEEGLLVRGHILPSGWVIEPVGNQYSMVTYFTHVALCGKDVPVAFNQFLSVRVPLSIAYLRLFLEAQLP